MSLLRNNSFFNTLVKQRYSNRNIQHFDYNKLNKMRLLNHCKCYSKETTSNSNSTNVRSSLTKSTSKSEISHHVHSSGYEKIKQGSKNIYYTGIILTGVGGLCILLYTLFKELISSNSPNNIHSKLLDQCSKDKKVMNVLGDQIKGFQDSGRRGNRSKLSHKEFIQDGVKHMLMSFYIEGVRRRGTVKADLIEDENGYFITRLLYIEVEGYPLPLIVENNTNQGSKSHTESSLEELTY